MAMANVHDAAAYLLERTGPIDTWRFQKLLYYCQAWSLVWDSEPLFDSRIEAWANGPVVRELYANHRGQFKLTGWQWGDSAKLSSEAKENIDAVLRTYGDKTGHFLSALAHREPPWRDARVGIPEGERGDAEIPHDAMAEYYGSLVT